MNTRTTQATPSRNAPCPCGSGKKYKRCCGGGKASQAADGKIPDRLQQALRLYQQGNLQAAAAVSDELLRAQPNDPGLLELSAVIALQLGRVELAVERFDKQIRLQPGNALAHSNLCMALHTIGRDEEAFRHGQQAILLQPDLADAWNNLGNIYRSGNSLEKAREHYEKALALDGGDPRVHVNAGSVSQLLGDLETAERRYRDALGLYPDFEPAHNNLGTVLQKQERYADAARHFRRALELQPGNPETLTNLGLLYAVQEQPDKARECYEKAIKAGPDYVGAYVNLGSLLEIQNDRTGARKYYDQALSLDPDNAVVHCNLAYSLFELGEQKQAVDHFVRALRSDPNSAKSLAGYGKALLVQGAEKKAVEYIEKALSLAPWDVYVQMSKARLDAERHDIRAAEAGWKKVIEMQPQMSEGYIGLANLFEYQGLYDKARAEFQRAESLGAVSLGLYRAWYSMEEHTHHLEEAEWAAGKAQEIDPNFPALPRLKAKLASRRKDYTGALAWLEQVDRDAIQHKQEKSNYLFALGGVYDKLGRYAEAFASFEAAARAKNDYTGSVYDHEMDARTFRHRQAFFSAEHWDQLRSIPATVAADAPCPVFIVGFPRSGTSLLEQILGAHPRIAPAGELTFVNELFGYRAAEIIGSSLPYPDCLLDPAAPLDSDKLAAMRDFYLDGVSSMGVTDEHTLWVTDKMPHNSVHLGLISLLFPESPIIHIARHPFNSCLSAYFSNFKGHPYTSSLEDTAQHYRHVMEMIEHYRKVVDMKFLRIRYEDLVEDQEAIVRRVLDFIGAPWDEACLQHHKSKRVVRTASYEQVTQKVYRSSLHRYRNYREQVEPLIPILEPTLAMLGYSTD